MAILCSFLRIDNASAAMWFSFGNLLFAVNICHLPGPKCHIDCDRPFAPSNICSNLCNNSSSNRRLDGSGEQISWSEAACDSISTSSAYYQTCVDGATADCDEGDIDSEYQYSDADASNYVDGDVNSVTGGVPEALRSSFLPYVVAASVATMFLILYAWKKRRDDQQLRKEDLLGDDESFHGAVAQRFDRATIEPSTPPADLGGKTSGLEYALA